MNTISEGITRDLERIERAFPSWMAPTFNVGPMGFPPALSNPCVDLSGLLGTPAAQDPVADEPVDSVLPGECFYCHSKATHTKGSGEPLCRYHKQFFWSKPIIEEDETCKS